MTAAERFWQQVKQGAPEECWIWLGTLTGIAPWRYGMLWDGTYRVNGKGRDVRRETSAHRFSYRLHFGDIPDGLSVLHRCDVPSCVNPAHLFLGTQADNMRDMIEKNRQRADNRGHRNAHAKLTPDQVAEIRRMSTGRLGEGLEFARRFGVSSGTISRVIHGRTWREGL